MNPARSDNMIIQSICLLDQLDKDLNTFAMRVREWYCWHFPELRELVKDNYMFARCAAYIKVRVAHDFCLGEVTPTDLNSRLLCDLQKCFTSLIALHILLHGTF